MRKKILLYFGPDFCGWYNFGKIIIIVVPKCHILKVKCTKFDVGWGSAPDPATAAWGGLQRSPPLGGFEGPTSTGKRGKGKVKGSEEKGLRGMDRKGEGST